MLQKKARLSRSRVNYLVQKGKFFANKFFTVRYVPVQNFTSRFCVVVGLKIEKKAVGRNRLRRQIYEVLRLNQHQLKDHYNIMLISKKTLLGLDYKEIEKAILITFQSLNSFKR